MNYRSSLFSRLRRCSGALTFPLLLTLAVSPFARAQVESGKVLGEVRDSSGAAVAGAKARVSNVDTGVIHEVTTGSGGEYAVTELRPGTYTLTVERDGFKKAIQEPFRLDVNQVVRIDITMSVGSVQEQVLVTAAEPLVESQTSSTGQ